MTPEDIGLLISTASLVIGVSTMIVVQWENMSQLARRLLALALGVVVVLTAFSLTAEAQECSVATIEGGYIVGRQDAPDIALGLVGPNLHITIGEFDGPEGWEGFTGETSVVIPSDDTVATVCPDGSVSFETVQVTETPENEGMEDLTVEEAEEVEAGGTDVPEDRISVFVRPLGGTGGPQEF
jgi:hypothetical protein